jgi:4-hydroxy-2-oxoheptanedioate aldolase
MNAIVRNQNMSRKRMVCASGLAVVACTMLTTGSSAQQGGAATKGRLNQIIAQFEQGKSAFANEHWQLFGIEHNPFALEDLRKGLIDLRPTGSTRPRLTPIVRIEYEGDQDFKHAVKQYLDVGVMGIVVPQVRRADEARKLVSAMRYPPQNVLTKVPREPRGVRGVAAARAGAYWGLTPDEYATKADVWPLNPEGELLAIVMIEHIDAVKNIREILSVPGLGAILIGQSDLVISMGLGTPAGAEVAQNKPEVQAAVAQVAKACVELKKLCGTFQGDIKTRVSQGFRLFTQQRGEYRD